jgi:NTE family protein
MSAVSMTQQSDAHAHVAQTRPPFECIALVLQGGGALGAYQAGVYQALDAANLAPDWICGISIGAFNSAIIAGNPPGARVDKLREFWESITQPYVDWEQPPGWEIAEAEAAAAASLAPQSSDFWTLACKWVPGLNADTSRGFLNQWSAGRVLWNGTPGFFALRPVTPWFWPGTSVRATSYYDTTALKSTLERLVDFDRINHGPMRLSVGAVNVRTGNFVYFDTSKDRIRAEHIMASGALPPAFAAVEIDGEYFWDGGLVSPTRRCAGWSTAAPKRTRWFSRSIYGRRAASFRTTWRASARGKKRSPIRAAPALHRPASSKCRSCAIRSASC